jgi:hypothetical protein
MAGGEEGGGRPRWPQCRRVGGSVGQCACTGGSKGCGWRLVWCLDSRRGGGRWSAPASFGLRPVVTAGAAGRLCAAPRQMRGRRGCVALAGGWGASLGPTGRTAAAHATRAGRARLVTAVRRSCHGTATWPALRRGATWPGVGEGASTHPGPTASPYGRKYAGRVGAPRRADVVTSRPECAGAFERLKVALFNWLKQ